MTESRVPPPDSALADLLAFLDASPTPYHAVRSAADLLEGSGFSALDDGDDWTLAPGDRRYAVRAGSSILAVRAGTKPPSVGGFRIVGAHTDSPTLRVKPRPARTPGGYLSLDVEVYGGALLATWPDRDLSIAGRVIVARGGRLEARLVRIDRPIARIPNLAIHLNRGVNEDGLKLDRHHHLAPALALWNGKGTPDDVVVAAIAKAAAVEPKEVRGFDLCLFDVQPAAVGGLDREFVFSARLDNLSMCRAALAGILASAPTESTSIAVLFDHEEVGSESAEGAGGAWLRDALARIEAAIPGQGGLPRALAKSFIVSADMAHGVHPNHADRHDGHHGPVLNGGPVVKTNASRRYATDGATGAFFRGLCEASRVPCQEFVMRADLACGSTIGPIVSARLGVRGVDVGSAMLSMHSAREMAGAKDPAHMAAVFTRFFSGTEPLP